MKWLIPVCVFGLFSLAAQAQDTPPPASGNARAACKADYQKLCQGVRPGGGRAAACLNQHLDELSPACKDVIQKHAQSDGGNNGNPPSTPSTPSKPQQ
jgi:Cysteine rich repeat